MASTAIGAAPKRVLVLNPFVRDVAPFGTFLSSFQSTLARELGEPVDIYEVPLDLARSSDSAGEELLVAFLDNRIRSNPVDLVVCVGGAGTQFAARHRAQLFPNTPLVAAAADPRTVPPSLLADDTALVLTKADLAGMVEDILQMRPETNNIVVVFGASILERMWLDQCRREFARFADRVTFTYLDDLPLDQVVKRCAALPPRSFILHGLYIVDAAGIPCERNEALRRLHQEANAPIFGYYVSEMGHGTIGGRLYQDAEVGAQSARTAIRVLRGEKAGSIPMQVMEMKSYFYDWRELRRWGVDEARLPVGAAILFREPTFWEQYRWTIAGTVVFCLLQAGLIVGLLVNRVRRREAEAEAVLIADISSKFVNLPPNEIDREITDAQRRICELLGLDEAALWQSAGEGPIDFTLTHLYSRDDDLRPSHPPRTDDHPIAFSLDPGTDAGRPRHCALFTPGIPARGRARSRGEPPTRYQVDSQSSSFGGRRTADWPSKSEYHARGTRLAGEDDQTAAVGCAGIDQRTGAQTCRPCAAC